MFTQSQVFEYWSIFPILASFVLLLFLVDIILRAVALWRAARANQILWFISLLLFNTMSILPIIYLVFFAQEPLYQTWQKQTAKQNSVKTKTKAKKRLTR